MCNGQLGSLTAETEYMQQRTALADSHWLRKPFFYLVLKTF
jgi:hypothetical protein